MNLFLDNDECDEVLQNFISAFIWLSFVYENILVEDDENDEMQLQIVIALVFDADELLDMYHFDVR